MSAEPDDNVVPFASKATVEEIAIKKAREEGMALARKADNADYVRGLVNVAAKAEEAKGFVREAKANVAKQATLLTNATLDAARKEGHAEYWIERLTREARG